MHICIVSSHKTLSFYCICSRHEAVPKIHSELQSISGQYATLSSNCMKFDGSVTQTEEIAGKCGYCPNNRPFFIATM